MQRTALMFTVALVAAGSSAAGEVRYYEENGVTYREVRETVSRPVAETSYQTRQQTVYRQETKTEVQKCCRTIPVKVIEYKRVTRWRGLYNPLLQPYLVDEMVPVVRWEYRTQEYEVPVTRTVMVPETRTEKVPVMTRRMIQEEVTRRVAVGPAGTAPANVAQTPAPARNVIGGISQLQNDPPRVGTAPGATIRR